MPSLERSKLQLIVFDFDGVLTDNRVLVIENGLEAVFCNRADGLGFDMMRAASLPVMIMSTERNAVVGVRAAKLRVPVLQAVRDKRQALVDHCRVTNIELGRVLFVGNDLNDLSIMRAVGFPVAVADAHESVKAVAWRVLKAAGGEGAARELAEDILGLTYD